MPMPMPCARRRGEVLREAVLEAALAEIIEMGMRRLTMERIARRAGTGKAALYRRWPNVHALAMEAVLHAQPSHEHAAGASTGSLRSDLIAVGLDLRAALDSTFGPVMRELIAESAADPALLAAVQERYGVAQQELVATRITQAVERGEIAPATPSRYLLSILPALGFMAFMTTGRPPSRSDIATIVDEILLPLLGAPAYSPADSASRSLTTA